MQLHGEALELVLQCLTEARDIVRCSSVSKAWAQASKHTQVSVLELQHCSFVPGALEKKENKDAQAKLRWLRRLHQADQLAVLQEITLYDSQEAYDSGQAMPSVLSQGVTVLAGFWQLRKVSLQGHICFKSAVALLPTSLLVLELYPYLASHDVYLSDFLRFTELKGLNLVFSSVNGNLKCILDTTLSSLVFLAIHHDLHCITAPNCDVSGCLPNINHLSVVIKADDHGLRLASDVLKLASLRKVEVNLLDGPGHARNLVVPEHSF